MRRSLLAAVLAMLALTWPADAQLFPSQPAAEPRPAVPAATEKLDTSPYAGRWVVRTGALRITHDGHAIAEWKLNRWCHEGPPPCDISNTDVGGMASLTFTKIQDGALVGQVDWTTFEGRFRSGPITIRFVDDGSLETDQSGVKEKYCGPTMRAEDRVWWGC